MRRTRTSTPGMGHLGARATIFAAVAAAMLLVLGQSQEAEASHGGTFGFSTNVASADEGNAVQFDLITLSHASDAPQIYVGIDIVLGTAESGDTVPDFCIPVVGAYPTESLISIPTFVDGDSDDETFTVNITFDSGIVACANSGGHAVTGGVQAVAVTIHDTTSGGTPTFDFESAASSRAETAGPESIIVNRTGSLAETESVDCVVTGGTATLNVDYTFVAQQLVFSPSETQQSCSFTLINDGDAVNETIIFHLEDPSTGSQVGATANHTVTILDSSLQSVQFSAPTYSRNENGGVATFEVTRTNPSGTVTVDCVTEETGSGSGHADEGVDFGATNSQIEFTGTDTSELCSVPITNDQASEGAETFRLVLQGLTGAGAVLGGNDEAVVTIVDDETAATYKFSATNYDVSEGAGTVTVTVERSVTTGSGSVQWDLSNGTATAGADYTDNSGTVTFTAGEASDSFTVTILQDQAAEGNQTINVTLLNPVSGTLGSPSTATITILDDEGIPTITNVAPNTIAPAGGASVVITGTNFTGATSVKFGGTNATSFVVNNATQITAVAPAKAAGTYDITVTNAVGTNVNTAADNITYQVTQTTAYTLTKTWTLLAWLGKDNIQIASAVGGVENPDIGATNSVSAYVTAVAMWDAPNQRYLFWFPGGASVPGANDITVFRYGTAYWVAVNATTPWTVLLGP